MSISAIGWSQNSGYIEVNGKFQNTTGERLIYLPETKFDKLLEYKVKYEVAEEKIENYKELVHTKDQRIQACDSTLNLRTEEANLWKSKLDANDLQLESVRKENAVLEGKIEDMKRSRLYYLGAGIVATALVFLIIQ